MYLTQIKMKEIQEKQGNVNWVFIFDRSGSMSYVLRKLGDDLIRLSSMLNVGDTVSLAYFSGKGQFRFIVKGFLISGDKNIQQLKDIINKNLTPIGTTCFSEVLADTVKTINELKDVYPDNVFCLSFLTDGLPYPDSNAERNAIFAALKDLRELIGDALFVGYTNYYDKFLLSQMTEAVGGSFAHADQIEDYSKNVEVIINSGGKSRKVVIDLPDSEDVVVVFGKDNNRVSVFAHEKGKAYVPETQKEVFVVSKGQKDQKVDEDTVYASAYALASQNKIDECLEWLGKVGDKYLIDKIYNAFTTSEIGDAINELHAAVFDSSLRFKDGKKKNYVPAKDAFCLLEALEILVNDDSAYFYPNRKEFVYQRTGVKSIQKDGYPKFQKDENAKSPFANLVWNKELLNLGVLTRINGKIAVPDDGVKLVGKELNCYQWKNYALIKCGFLNVRKLPCSMSKTTFLALQSGGLVQKNWKWKEDEVYVLDLKRIPIINRAIADDYTSAKEMANLAVEEQHLAANMKVLKYFWNKYAPEVVKETAWTAQFNDDQLSYLINTLGMRNDGSYSPPSEAGEVEDYYEANTFQIKVKGWSSLPKVEEVVEKSAKGAKLNAPSLAMKNAYDTYKSEKILEYFDKAIDITKKKMSEVRNKIQRGKFSLLLAKRKFKEFPKMKDVNVIKADDGTEVTFELGKKKIAY